MDGVGALVTALLVGVVLPTLGEHRHAQGCAPGTCADGRGLCGVFVDVRGDETDALAGLPPSHRSGERGLWRGHGRTPGSLPRNASRAGLALLRGRISSWAHWSRSNSVSHGLAQHPRRPPRVRRTGARTTEARRGDDARGGRGQIRSTGRRTHRGGAETESPQGRGVGARGRRSGDVGRRAHPRREVPSRIRTARAVGLRPAGSAAPHPWHASSPASSRRWARA